MCAMHPKLVFMGSPEFALPVLHALVEHYAVVGVVTQPDRPAGRGKVLTPPPVKPLAERYQLPIIQPRRLSQPDAFAQLVAWQPDVIIVAAFGQILKPQVLDLPAFGCINVHASLLPRWRGAAPIQAAIMHGDKQTGVTIMRMDAGIDTGGILSQQAIEIHPQDTSLSLSARLAELGANLLLETLPEYLAGRIPIQEQDDQFASYAPMLKKEDGLLDFHKSAKVLERQVRAFNPWPGAYMEWKGQLIKILRSYALPHQMGEAGTPWEPGTKLRVDNRPAVSTAEGLLVLDVLQPAGKKALTGNEFLNGARDWER
jgi:methionyl-tRNA formyltransferase